MECGRHTQRHSVGENLSFLPRQVSLYRLQIASKLGVGLCVHFTIYLHAGILFVLNSYRSPVCCIVSEFIRASGLLHLKTLFSWSYPPTSGADGPSASSSSLV